jgi:Fis family transcriptional regulator, factor for inversion stimulation protein
VKSQLEVLVSQMYDSNILYAEAVREFKKTFIAHVLEQHRGNQCKAAKQLGMHRNTLSRTLDELGLDVKEIRRQTGERRPPRSVQPLDAVAMEKKAAR